MRLAFLPIVKRLTTEITMVDDFQILITFVSKHCWHNSKFICSTLINRLVSLKHIGQNFLDSILKSHDEIKVNEKPDRKDN